MSHIHRIPLIVRPDQYHGLGQLRGPQMMPNLVNPYRLFSSGSGVTPITPSDLANLALWYKADTGVFSDAGTTPAADTNTVQQWNDQSGNAKNASQSTSGNRPTYRTNIINGLPIIRYTGSHFFSIARAGFKTYTAFFVCKRTSASIAQMSLLADQVSGGNHELYLARGSDSTGRMAVWDSTNGYVMGATASLTRFEVYTYRKNDSTKKVDFWVGQDLQRTQQSFGSASPAVGTNMWQGQGTSGGERLNADIGEWWIYDVALSDSDVAGLQQYAINKFALGVPTLRLWLGADSGVYKDAGSTPAADTETVQQWNDQSGLGFNFSQATSGNRPTYRTGQINGLPALQFRNGTPNYLANASFGGTIAYTILFVIKRISDVNTGNLLSWLSAGSAHIMGFTMQRTSGNAFKMDAYQTSDYPSTNALPDNTWTVGAVVFDHTTQKARYWIGQSQDSVVDATGIIQPGATTNARLGTAGTTGNADFSSGAGMNADLAEIKVYDGKMADSDVQTALAGLAAKYGL